MREDGGVGERGAQRVGGAVALGQPLDLERRRHERRRTIPCAPLSNVRIRPGIAADAPLLLALFDEDRARIAGSRGGSIYQSVARQSNLEVFDHLRRKVALTIPATATATGLSKPTVARALDDLSRLGITHEATGKGRNRVLVYSRYLDLLNRDSETA